MPALQDMHRMFVEAVSAASPEVADLRLDRVRLLVLRALAHAQSDREAVTRYEVGLATVQRALAAAGPGRDDKLARQLSLDRDELELVWVATALTADPLVAPHAVALGGSEARRGASLAFFAAIVDLPSHRLRELATSLGPGHPLRQHGLLEPADGDMVEVMTPFRAARRLVSYLRGDDEPDSLLVTIPIPIELARDAQLDQARQRLAATLGSGEDVLVLVRGREGAGRRTLAACAAYDAGRTAVACDIERLPPTVAGLDEALVALRREHLLADALPVIAGLGDVTPERDGISRTRRLERFIDSVSGPVVAIASASDVELHPRRPVVTLELSIPEPSSRREMWQRALGTDSKLLDNLAVRYRMAAGDVGRVVTAARISATARGDSVPTDRDLADGVRAAIGQKLRGLAEHVEVKHDWDDLIAPDDIREQLLELVARVKHSYQVLETWRFRNVVSRGGGVAALFSGEPGTGKTMAAGLIAKALDLDLYQVDLSAVVSKWVGETEKNLSRLFDAADAGQALLLFDEADSLFAKRTEVKGSNDRYANLEVNHLLQRIEAFGGVAILTTNMDASLDPALRRRLAAKVDFWAPDEDERAALWSRLLEGRAPLAADVDVAQLARRYDALTGGTIRNVVVAAAFRAAAMGSRVTHAVLERAAVAEYKAIGRIWNKEHDR
ncbi:MAG TPA: ATP-binding protein [Kofleriaceae bacterium]